MISVPNLRQLLSGSKLLLLFCSLSLFSSCELFKKAQGDKDVIKTGDQLDPISGRKVYDPETGTYIIVEEYPSEKMDTIIWKEITTSMYPPITSDGITVNEGNPVELIRVGDFGSEILSSYNVSILLPFLSDKFNPDKPEIYSNSQWALHFYGGLKIALDELSGEGVRLNVSVLDSKASDRTVADLLRNNTSLFNANLIIGPYRRDNVRLLAEFARYNNITYISPHSAASRLSQRNPNYIQVSPTLRTHCEAITRDVRRNYQTGQVILVARNKPAEIARFKYFHDENYLISAGMDTSKFREFIVDDQSADFGNMDVMPFIALEDTTVFIIPSWSNETFIYSFLRKVNLAKGEDNHIVVYGMPQWMRFERADFDYYEKLNVHVSSSSYLDPLSPSVQLFKRKFFDRYGAIPSDEAFLGYDTMLYFGRMLNKYGTKFQYYLDREPFRSLHTRFEFGKVIIPTTTGMENLPVEQFENKYVNILKFQDYQFQLSY